MEDIHTRVYSLDETTGEWKKHGVVIEDGFWAMNQPVRMDNGNWIMPGGSFGLYSNESVFPAAVAISRGDDLTKWDFEYLQHRPLRRRRAGPGRGQQGLRPHLDSHRDIQPAHGHLKTGRRGSQHRAALPRLHDRDEQRRQADPADHRGLATG